MSEIVDFPVPQAEREDCQSGQGNSAGAGFGTSCGADRTRDSRDSTTAGSAAHHRVRTPVTAPVEYETDEVREIRRPLPDEG